MPRDPAPDLSAKTFRRAALAVIVYVVATMLGPILEISLLLFTGLLVAVALDAAISWLQRVLRMPRWLALVIVMVVAVLVMFAFVVMVAPRLASELEKLWALLPSALDQIGDRLGQASWGERFIANVPTIEEALGQESVLRNAFGALSGVVGVIGAGFLVVFTGLFVAADPRMYLKGILHFVPPARRASAEDTLTTMAVGLRRWLLAKFLGMAIIGVATWLGLIAVGIPLAFALGILAAALTFIPNIGPFLSAIPAVLLGFLQGPTTALVIVALYIGIQLVESYVVSPVIQRRMLALPPALTLGAQALLGAVAGSLGIVVATPLLAAVMAARIVNDPELADLAQGRDKDDRDAAPSRGAEPQPA